MVSRLFLTVFAAAAALAAASVAAQEPLQPAVPEAAAPVMDGDGGIDGIAENERCHDQFFEGGSPALAVVHCTRALESGDLAEGDRVTALVNRGVARKLTGDLAAAVEDYTAALALAPEAGDIFATRANAYLEMSLLDLAITDANKALAFRPDYAAAYYVRGRIFEALGQNTFARDDFLRAYDLAPGNADIEAKAWAFGANQNQGRP